MPEFPQILASEHLFDMQADLAPPDAVGATPFGVRSIFVVTGGTFEGPRLRGTLRPGGADWLLTRSDGAGELDVRATLETDDGALVYAHYHGVLDAAPEVLGRIFGGEDVPLSAYYFRTTPRFETGAPQYAWLNRLVAVGVGHAAPNRVSYRVFAIQ